MQKIYNSAAPTIMVTKNQPLSTGLTIVQVNKAPLTQAQDTQQAIWLPDRTESPLILDYLFEAYDVELNQKVNPSHEVRWFIVSGETETRITSTTTSDDYYLETSESVLTGRLVVRKNVDYLSPVHIRCRVIYADTINVNQYLIDENVLLTAENKPEEFYAVKIQTTKQVYFSPLLDASSQKTFTAIAYRGDSTLPSETTESVTALVKFFWYIEVSGVQTLFSTSVATYVSGQYTPTLTLDADMGDEIKIVVKIGCLTQEDVEDGMTIDDLTEPNAICSDSVEMRWKWPDIEAMPYSTQGSAIIETDESKAFKSIVKANHMDASDDFVKRYVRLNWKEKSTTSSTVNDLGWGEEKTIPASTLRKTGGANSEVSIDVYRVGPTNYLTDDNDELIVDNSGSATASDYNGYVVSSL